MKTISIDISWPRMNSKGLGFTPILLFLVNLFCPLAFGTPATNDPNAASCPGVFITTSGPTSASPGDILTYQIRIKNEQGCSIQNAIVTDYLPRSSRFLSAQPEPSIRPEAPGEPRVPVSKVEWTNVPIGALETADVFEVSLVMGDVAGRVVTNTACIEHASLGRRCDTFQTYVRAAGSRAH